ncbi:MAG: hypothetical protein ABIB71_05295 [Candidatus Woesearchaeota archaeon]
MRKFITNKGEAAIPWGPSPLEAQLKGYSRFIGMVPHCSIFSKEGEDYTLFSSIMKFVLKPEPMVDCCDTSPLISTYIVGYKKSKSLNRILSTLALDELTAKNFSVVACYLFSGERIEFVHNPGIELKFNTIIENSGLGTISISRSNSRLEDVIAQRFLRQHMEDGLIKMEHVATDNGNYFVTGVFSPEELAKLLKPFLFRYCLKKD